MLLAASGPCPGDTRDWPSRQPERVVPAAVTYFPAFQQGNQADVTKQNKVNLE